jgi:hypothetical protein
VRLSTYVYPWDLARLGVQAVFEELAAAGVTGVDLTASYHTITAFSPRAGAPHVYSSPRGGVFFPARRERYGVVAPAVVDDAELLRVWPEAARRAGELGLELAAWTVALFQPWMAQDHPDTARVLPSGERSTVGACPASEQVREYLGALCADVADRFGPSAIKLENVAFPDFDYGWYRPRVLAEVPVRARSLLGVCFCGHCRARGRAAGVDVDALQARVVTEVDGLLDEPEQPRDVAAGPHDELAAYVATAERAVTELVTHITGAVREVAPPTRVVVATPIEPCGSRGVDLAAVIDGIGGVQLWSPRRHAAAIEELRPVLDRRPDLPLSYFHPPGFDYRVGSPDWLDELRAAVALPVDEISFYHYGLLRGADFDRTVRLTRELVEAA